MELRSFKECLKKIGLLLASGYKNKVITNGAVARKVKLKLQGESQTCR